jgi:putative polyhydroxyalkanoate system protein
MMGSVAFSAPALPPWGFVIASSWPRISRQWYVASVESMSTILIRRQHGLGLAEAKRLAESIARRLQNDYGGAFTWKGNDLHFRRTGASGSVAVTKENFQVHLELGLLLSPLHSLIEREIVTYCDEHLGAAGRSSRGQPARPAARRRRDTRSA